MPLIKVQIRRIDLSVLQERVTIAKTQHAPSAVIKKKIET